MPTLSCEYSLADYTYNEWLLKLKDDKFKNVNYSLKQNILNFFHFADASNINRRHSKKCVKFFEAYHELDAMEPNR